MAEDSDSRSAQSGNRFEFLEIGDHASPARDADLPPSAGFGEPFAPRFPDGTAFAEVRAREPVKPHQGLEQRLIETETAPTYARSMRKNTEPGLRVAEIVGGRGSRAGQFNFPTGLAVDGLGILFVADSYNHRVQRITPSGEVSIIGSRGSGKGRFLSPQGIATDPARAFYIVEQGNHRVQKYSANGILELIFGKPGTRDGELRNPTGIAVAPCSGDIYIADTGNTRVQRFDCDGNFLTSIGGRSGIYSALVSPQALAVDNRDHLYVVDTFAHRIIQYDPLGRPIARFRHGRLREPRAVASTAAGILVVADLDPAEAGRPEPIGRMQALDSQSGELRNVLTMSDRLGPLLQPGGLGAVLAYDKQAGSEEVPDIYIADTMNHRILRVVWN